MKKRLGRKIAAWLMCLAMVLTTINLPVFTTTVKAVETKDDVRVYTPELQELVDAVELGLGTYVDDTSEVSYSQYAQMLQRLVELCCPNNPDKVEEWCNRYPKVWACTDKINRANAMYMLFICARDVIGGEYYNPNYNGIWMWETWHRMSGELNLDWSEYRLRTDLFADALIEETGIMSGEGANPRFTNAYFYSLQKKALNGNLLFDYDEASNSMRINDILTMEEAMWSVVRLYQSVDPFDVTLNQPQNILSVDKKGADANKIYSYNKDIITDDLLARANEMEILKPSLNPDEMPYYTGIHYDWGSSATNDTETCVYEVPEGLFKEASELGFNYVRVVVTCKTFFDIGDSEHVSDALLVKRYNENYINGGKNEALLTNDETAIITVDLAALNKLDEIISYGLKYGLHINLQFFDYPGHIMFYTAQDGEFYETDFAENLVKQQQTGQMWALIAERYKNISNNVLSFTITHEPWRGDCSTDEAIKASTKVVYDAIRQVDQNRFIYDEFHYASQGSKYIGYTNDLDDDGTTDIGSQINYDAIGYNYWFNLFSNDGDLGQSYGEVSALGGYFAHMPSYWVPMYVPGDKKIIIDGFLPAGTQIKMTGWAWPKERTFPVNVTSTSSDDTCEEIYSQEFSWGYSEAPFDISFVLQNDAKEIEIDMGLSASETYKIDRESFVVTLPEEYRTKKWYLKGYINGIVDENYNLEQRDNSDITFKVYGAMSDFKNIADIENENSNVWILDDSNDIKISVKQDGTYETNYGFTEEVIEKDIAVMRKRLDETETVAVNLELYIGKRTYEEDAEKYLDTVLYNYKKNNLSWVFYSMLDLFWSERPGSEDLMAFSRNGLKINQSMCNILKKNMGKRPIFYITVPDTKNEIKDYCVSATLYKDEVCTEEKENLGFYNSIDSLNKVLGEKSGYLYVENYSRIGNELPYGENLDGVTLSCPNGLEFTSNEITLSSDIKVLNDIHIADSGMAINGNGHQLILEAAAGGITISGGNLYCENLSMVLSGNSYVVVKSNMDGLSDLKIGYLKDGYILDKDNIDDAWSNIVGNTVLINEGSINVNTLCTYGKDIYMLNDSKLDVQNVGGIYGNVIMQMKDDGILPELTVTNSMQDMVWQIRIQIFKGALSKDDYVVSVTKEESCPQGTILAYIPDDAHSSVVEKLGWLPNDTWDEYSKKQLLDGRLYYDDDSSEIDHLWENDYTEDVSATCGKAGKKSIHCSVCDVTKDVTEIPATGNHDFMVQTYLTDDAGKHYQKCKDCGAESEHVACTSGEAVKENIVAPTCAETGSHNDVVYCTVCDQKLATTSVTDPATEEHTFTKYVSNGNGTHKVVCTYCGAIQEGHDKDACSGGTATCKAKAKCSKCKAEYGSLKSHTNTTTTTKATTSKDGSKVTKCSVCGKVASTTTIAMPKTFTLSKTSVEYTGSQIKPTITVKDKNGTTIAAANYTVTYGTNKAVGKGTVKVTFKSTSNYSGSKELSFNIIPKKTTIGTPAIASDGITVKWTKNTSCAGYYIYRSVNGASYTKVKTVTSNATVSWKDTGAKTNGNKYQYKIVAYKTVSGTTYTSAVSAIKTMYFVSKPSLSSLTNSASGKMLVKWARNAKASGYQIQYSTSSSFTSPKSVTATGNTSTLSKTIGSLTKGKTFYVRIRTYKTVGSTKYYSAWSAKKTVKITK